MKDFPKKDTEKLTLILAVDIVRNTYTHGKVPELDQKVAAAFKKLTGITFSEQYVPPRSRKIPPSILHGPPGQGKSTVVKIAAMQAAKAMGMRFITDEDIDAGYQPTLNDLFFTKVEMAGQVSPIGFTGIPGKSEENTMRVLPPDRFKKSTQAGASVWLFDDLGNAAQRMIPVLLGIFQDRKYGEHSMGERSIPFGTTNLGQSMDGAIGVSQIGTALGNRVRQYYVEDNLENWISRYEKELAHRKVDDCGLVGFLRKYPNLFNTLNVDEVRYRQTAFASARSISNFADSFPFYVSWYKAGNMQFGELVEECVGLSSPPSFPPISGITSKVLNSRSSST